MLSPSPIIQKKRDGHELTKEEIRYLISGLKTGAVADYQITAWLMAVYFKGMTLAETVALTEAMIESGERNDLSKIPGRKIDKHSTGGVGDKISLILAPLAAACGLKVPMMAGRGLGHSGGTVDKLESIPGYRASLTRAEFEKTVASVGCVLVGQSDLIAPADKKLYAFRDVTATIECIPLIVASILSKKIAEGTEGLIMDVKVGNGAFMKDLKNARLLAATLSKVAKKMGLSFRAVITDMNQPLGCTVGNSLEIIESINILRGEKSGLCEGLSTDVKELTLHLCAQMLQLGGLAKSLADGRKKALDRLADGSAWAVFERMVEAQGGDLNVIRNPSLLPLSKRVVKWTAKRRGYLVRMDTRAIGQLLVEMGGGRKQASDTIDPGVGFIFHKKLGSAVSAQDALVTVYAPQKIDLAALEDRFHHAIEISSTRKPVPKLILDSKA